MGVSAVQIAAALAIGTGLRRGGLLGLRWQDVDLKAGKFAVRQNLQKCDGTLVFKSSKTVRGRRSVSLIGPLSRP